MKPFLPSNEDRQPVSGSAPDDAAPEPGNRALQFVNGCNAAVIRSESEKDLTESVCRIALDAGGFAMAWVGYARNDTDKPIVPQAVAGLGDRQLPEAAITWSDDEQGGQSVPATVVRTGEPLLIADLESGGYFRPWKEFELERGFRGMICLPLKERTRTFGVLVLYVTGSIPPEGDSGILIELAETLSIGIGRHRANAELRRTHDAVLSMAGGMSAGASGGAFGKLIACAAEALGADAGFIARLNADGTRATTACAIVDGQAVPDFEYFLADSPCGMPGSDDAFFVPECVRTFYPNARSLMFPDIEAYAGAKLRDTSGKAVGRVFLLFRQPQVESGLISSTMKILAARAARELERQKSDALMREQAALLEKAQDAILVHDFEYRISYWNKSAERMYGWSAAEAVGWIARDLIYHDAVSLVIASEITLTKGEWVGEIVQMTKDGEALTVEARWTLVCDENGTPVSILSINTDITQRKKLEQQFLRAQRMESIGTLAGGIAHDINNVLSPIMMSIDLLRMYVNDPDGLNILNMVAASARRGAEMVRQVLSFARGVEGKAEELEVSQIVDDLLRIIEETFPKDIRVETRLQPDLWLIKADPTQIHQVLLNLCVNARDAMPNGGRIAVKVQHILIDDHQAAMNLDARPGPYMAIEIEDTGHGIPKDIIEKIYDPFFTTKELGKGTGLGLSTTLAIMKSHGGFISASSEPGVGSRFRICIPAVTELGWASVEAPDVDLPRGMGETVMVVDDEIFVRQITSQTLESFGYKVLLAANGSDAITTYVEHQNEISVVLTDMMMPVMDGPATIRTLRRLNPFVRIIGASGINAKSNVARASSAGANHFLPKPYTAETLLKTIRMILKEPSSAPLRCGVDPVSSSHS